MFNFGFVRADGTTSLRAMDSRDDVPVTRPAPPPKKRTAVAAAAAPTTQVPAAVFVPTPQPPAPQQGVISLVDDDEADDDDDDARLSHHMFDDKDDDDDESVGNGGAGGADDVLDAAKLDAILGAVGKPPATIGFVDCFSEPIVPSAFCAVYMRKRMITAFVVAVAQSVTVVPVRETQPGVWAKSGQRRALPACQVVMVKMSRPVVRINIS